MLSGEPVATGFDLGPGTHRTARAHRAATFLQIRPPSSGELPVRSVGTKHVIALGLALSDREDGTCQPDVALTWLLGEELDRERAVRVSIQLRE